MPYSYTTPTIPLIVEGFDLSELEVWVTVFQYANQQRSRTRTVTIEDDDLAEKTYSSGTSTVKVTLTQEQSAKFHTGQVYAIINWMDSGGTRWAFDPVSIPWRDNALDQILTGGSGDAGGMETDGVTVSAGEIEVVTTSVQDGSIDTAKLAAKAVTAAKIADGAVGTTQLASSAVTTAKINGQAVTAAKIADGAVTPEKLDRSYAETADFVILSDTDIDALW